MINEPLPYTKDEIKDKQNRNNAMILFFISLSFSLIPANFITIIIRERENNSKHLQIISGISLFSYWFNNYLFELIKYYIIGGISILLLYLFKFYEDYLYILYLEYGPAMVSFTYLFSFIFKSEDKGQTVVLLINLIIGALGGSAIMIMRLKDDLILYSKPIIYIFRLIPSFCFCFGYNQLMSRNELFTVDLIQKYDEDKKVSYIDRDILKLEYMGYDCIYLAIESIAYLFILIFLENSLIIFKCCFISNKKNKNNVDKMSIYKTSENNFDNDNENDNENDKENDNEIYTENIIKTMTKFKKIRKEEITKNTNDSFYKKGIINSNEKNDISKNAIKVQNLVKTYYGGPFGFKILNCCCKSTRAVKNISFNLEYGEVFGLLGINGAGKTTTFKCLSNEIYPTSGQIYINEKDINSDFNKIRNLIGYCPQFDAIFDYLTVYENLEFYGLIKGAKKDKIKEIINALMDEIKLLPFKDIVSGTLSGGNKRKLSVAIAIICNPPIILLDEPSTGMDPEARRFMWGVIHRVSLNQKKSTIIMTTHSMEEAETLCKRIGILVNGEFKCLDTKEKIKEKYGYGYEINFQINTPDINDIYKMFHVCDEDKKQYIYLNQLEESLKLYKVEKYIRLIQKDFFGRQIFEELESKGYIIFDKILLWIYYLKNSLGLIKVIMNYFNKIYCIDYTENNFIFKIKKNKMEREKTIGFLFGLIEDNKSKYNIGQYFLQVSSLEQIFNNFAKENKQSNNDNSNNDIKIDICITQELINLLY